MAESSRRVVITGLGAVTPIGNSVSAYWSGLTEACNGVAPITLFDASRHACRFAAEVKDFDPIGVLDPKEAKRWDRFCQFGVVAAKEALAASGLEINDSNRQRIGVIIGSGVGGLLTMESQAHVLEGKGPGRVSPFTVPMMIPNMATGLAGEDAGHHRWHWSRRRRLWLQLGWDLGPPGRLPQGRLPYWESSWEP